MTVQARALDSGDVPSRDGHRVSTLYDDIGGAPAVRAALGAFYARVLADAMLSPFFLGVDVERLKKIQEGFFAMALGGPHAYTGRTVRDAHARMRH